MIEDLGVSYNLPFSMIAFEVVCDLLEGDSECVILEIGDLEFFC